MKVVSQRVLLFDASGEQPRIEAKARFCVPIILLLEATKDSNCCTSGLVAPSMSIRWMSACPASIEMYWCTACFHERPLS